TLFRAEPGQDVAAVAGVVVVGAVQPGRRDAAQRQPGREVALRVVRLRRERGHVQRDGPGGFRAVLGPEPRLVVLPEHLGSDRQIHGDGLLSLLAGLLIQLPATRDARGLPAAAARALLEAVAARPGLEQVR